MSDIDTKARAAAELDRIRAEHGIGREGSVESHVREMAARAKRCDELERLVRALRRAEGRRSRCEERFDSAIDTRWPAACEAAAEELEQARQAADAARAALFAAVERKGK